MAITLESIVTGKSNKPPQIVFYAVSGFGKTTFASQAYAPIFIQTEEGIGNLDYPRFPLAKSYKEVIESLRSLATEDHSYKTVVIDTLDALERLVFAEVVRRHNESGKKAVESIGDMAFGAGYTQSLELWQEVLKALDYLRDSKSMMVICLAHSLIKSFSPPGQDAYDRYRFNMHDKASELIKDWADIVLFGNYVVRTRSSGQGFNQEVKAIGGDERVIYTEERASHWAKNRYSLPNEIPFKKGEQFKTFISYLYPSTTKEPTI